MRRIRIVGIFLLLVFASLQNLAAAEQVALKVEDEDVRQVLFSLAQLSRENIILDDSVQGKITAELHDMEAGEAMDLLCKMKGLSCQKSGDGLLIASQQAALQNFGELFIFPVHFAAEDTIQRVVNLCL